jgi:hypothetical protein
MGDRAMVALRWWQDECMILRVGISDALQLHRPNDMRLALQRLRRETSERQRAQAEAVLASRTPIKDQS